MTDVKALHAEAAAARAQAAHAEPMRVPRGRPERQAVRADSVLRGRVAELYKLRYRIDDIELTRNFPSEVAAEKWLTEHPEARAKKVEKDGAQWYLVEGYASVVEQGYEMYDMFGPYTEVVSAGAFNETLNAEPMVVYRFNHGGMSMATTGNGRLELWADDTGLGDRAWLNPTRGDVQNLVKAIEDEDVTEQSFMFEITSGRWSPDYTEYRLETVNLDRGDVGPVTYGANPYTSVSARAGEFLADIPRLPALLAREALARLSSREDLQPRHEPTAEASGRSISMLKARLLAESGEDD